MKTTCVLHNWLRETSTVECIYTLSDMLNVEVWEEGWVETGTDKQHPHNSLSEIPHCASNNFTKTAATIRNYFAERFVTTDIIPWKWKMM